MFSLEMIVYKVNGLLAACGNLRENQKVLHCHDVPTDHECVLVTATKKGARVDAPLVLGGRQDFFPYQKSSSTGQVLDQITQLI